MAAIILTNLVFCVHYQEERDFIGCCQPASQDSGPPTPPAEGVKILLNTSRRTSLGFKDPIWVSSPLPHKVNLCPCLKLCVTICDLCSKVLEEATLPCPWPSWPHWPRSQRCWSRGTFGRSLSHFLPPSLKDARLCSIQIDWGWRWGGSYECHRRRYLLSLFQRK